jgi:hypothetical protein
MPRCVVCEYPIPDDRERVGARCPSCHEPLYEPAGRMARPPQDGEATCAVHTGMGTVGLCARCGNDLCETCRTRWRGQILCATCVDRALSAGEATSSQARAGRRQARRAIVAAAVVWLVAAGAAFAHTRLATPGDRASVVVTFAVFLVLVGDVGLAAFAIGQSVAALRVPEVGTVVPMVGLSVAGVYVAVILGLGVLGLW